MFEHSSRLSEPNRQRFCFMRTVALSPPVVRCWSFVIRPAVLVAAPLGCFWMGAAKAAGLVRGRFLPLAKRLRDVTQTWVWPPGMLE
jgi:hypothetical protein